jgi:hypothetical protein
VSCVSLTGNCNSGASKSSPTPLSNADYVARHAQLQAAWERTHQPPPSPPQPPSKEAIAAQKALQQQQEEAQVQAIVLQKFEQKVQQQQEQQAQEQQQLEQQAMNMCMQDLNTCQNLFLERRGQILQIRWPRIGQSIDNRRFSSVLVQRKKPDEV